ncbi:hypothetical protein [Isoptericola croceus]|uniref:hypothetical protein n=1 Tax=Isoptericola croceus TaxID=3031406 RepID=UPI0023F8418F|nr:hypothetical protein [Isoptericola croceus]
MRRVLLAGSAVAIGDGLLLGSAIALGWTVLALLAITVGGAGTLGVAMMTPPPRPRARPATVTLGLPLREVSTEDLETASATEDALVHPGAGHDPSTAGQAVPVAA